MKASDIISELSRNIEKHGDFEVIFRENEVDTDINIMSTYYDDDINKIVLSDWFY